MIVLHQAAEIINHIAVFCDLGSTFPSALIVSSRCSGAVLSWSNFFSMLVGSRIADSSGN